MTTSSITGGRARLVVEYTDAAGVVRVAHEHTIHGRGEIVTVPRILDARNKRAIARDAFRRLADGSLAPRDPTRLRLELDEAAGALETDTSMFAASLLLSALEEIIGGPVAGVVWADVFGEERRTV